MKRKVVLVFAFVLSFFLYADNYEDLLRRAEEYEGKKEWVFALGTYYDAIKESDDSNIATKKYEELGRCISSGNPGYGDYNVFTLHDEWKKLVQNAERYFTETFPYKVLYKDLTMGNINYETKTAEYNLSIEIEQTDLYKYVIDILKTGYNNTNHSDWKEFESEYKTLWFLSDAFAMLLHSSWDGSLSTSIDFYRKSIYSTQQKKINKVTEYPVLQKESNSIYQKEKIALSYLAAPIVPLYKSLSYVSGISVCEIPAFSACFSETMTTYSGQNYSVPLAVPYFKPGKHTCYDIKLGIYDEDEKLIIEGTRQTVNTGESYYTFNNVSQDKMLILDSKKYSVKIIGIWLNYGVYDISLLTESDIKNDTIRGIVKPLPDIKIKTDNVEFINKRILEEQLAKKEAEAKAAEESQWELFIAEMNSKYEEYKMRLNSASDNMDEVLARIGMNVEIKRTTIEVTEVAKKSVASKAKLSDKYELVAINDKNIKEIIDESVQIERKYSEIGDLINKARRLSVNDYQYKYEKTKIQSEYLRYKNIESSLSIIYDDNGCKYYLDGLISGDKLRFESNTSYYYGNIKLYEAKPIEIIVP